MTNSPPPRSTPLEELCDRVQRTTIGYFWEGVHPVNGATGHVVPFLRNDDGGDLVESALLLQGLICARQYFDGNDFNERLLRAQIQALVDEVEWCWYAPDPSKPLYWDWSPKHQWKMALPI